MDFKLINKIVSKSKELNKLKGDRYLKKLNELIRREAQSKGIEIPQPAKSQIKQVPEFFQKKTLQDPLEISDIKTVVLQKLGYKGFIAAEKGIGKEIVIFNPKDIIVK